MTDEDTERETDRQTCRHTDRERCTNGVLLFGRRFIHRGRRKRRTRATSFAEREKGRRAKKSKAKEGGVKDERRAKEE